LLLPEQLKLEGVLFSYFPFQKGIHFPKLEKEESLQGEGKKKIEDDTRKIKNLAKKMRKKLKRG